MHTHSSHSSIDLKDDKCFFCNKPAGSEGLHNASIYDIDAKVRRCAIKLEDTALLAKLEPGDMVALGPNIIENALKISTTGQGLWKAQSPIKVVMHICMVLHSQNWLLSWKTFEKKTLHLSSN